MTTPDDNKWMTLAIEQSKLCSVADGAYSVGAVIVDADGLEVSRGYSRETDEKVHAEESALAKIGDEDRPRLAGATIYSTLEPCSQRASRPLSCTHLVIAAGIPRVVTAWREPSLFVADCQGVELLEAAGLQVVELTEFAEAAKSVNSHLAIS